MAIGDRYLIKTVCNTASQVSINRLHYQVIGEVGGGLVLFDLLQAYTAAIAGFYKALMPPTAAFRGCSIKLVANPPGLDLTNSASAGDGTALGDAVPTQVSYIIKLNSLFGGGSFRGRVYPGFVATNHVDADGGLTAGAIVKLQDLADQMGPVDTFVNAGVSTTMQLMVRGTSANPAPPPPRINPFYSNVGLLTAQAKLATQRRRGQFGRTNPLPF